MNPVARLTELKCINFETIPVYLRFEESGRQMEGIVDKQEQALLPIFGLT